jgi:hypothetical protein
MKVYGDTTEVSGQFHTLVILPSRKEPQMPLAWGLSGPLSIPESIGEGKLGTKLQLSGPLLVTLLIEYNAYQQKIA